MTTRIFSILVVDDIPLMRLMFTKYIASAGQQILEPFLGPLEIRISEAADGNAASSMLATSHFDLVFLDLMMPYKDGLTVLAEIREQLLAKSVKVVVCSAVGEADVVRKALALGATAYIMKPYTREAVREKLKQIYAPPVTA